MYVPHALLLFACVDLGILMPGLLVNISGNIITWTSRQDESPLTSDAYFVHTQSVHVAF